MTHDGSPPRYQIEFFRRADGSEPVRRFIDSLSADKRDALLAALAREIERARGYLKEWQTTQSRERRIPGRAAKGRRARD
jgi:hypothetical protein